MDMHHMHDERASDMMYVSLVSHVCMVAHLHACTLACMHDNLPKPRTCSTTTTLYPA